MEEEAKGSLEREQSPDLELWTGVRGRSPRGPDQEDEVPGESPGRAERARCSRAVFEARQR